MRKIINLNRKWAFSKEATTVPTEISNRWNFVNLPPCYNAIDDRTAMPTISAAPPSMPRTSTGPIYPPLTVTFWRSTVPTPLPGSTGMVLYWLSITVAIPHGVWM